MILVYQLLALRKKRAAIFGVSRVTVLEVGTRFEKERKILSSKQNSERNRKLSELHKAAFHGTTAIRNPLLSIKMGCKTSNME